VSPTIRDITQLFILTTVIIWIGYDIYVYLTFGNPATESATIAVDAYYHPWIPFLAGILVGHLFFNMRGPLQFPLDEDQNKKN
jgi:hypothetical protein